MPGVAELVSEGREVRAEGWGGDRGGQALEGHGEDFPFTPREVGATGSYLFIEV